MGKRANREGSVYKRSDGRWCAALTYDDLATGKARRATFYGKTQAEARGKMREAKQRLDAGKPAKDAPTVLGDYAERWIETTLAASDRKESTKEIYARLARRLILTHAIAERGLDKLRASDIERLTLDLRADGKAASTIRQTYTIIRAILDAAVRDGLVGVNVATLVSRPGVPRTEARYLDPGELKALLTEADESRYGALLRVLAHTGMRRGEALALRWANVDLEKGSARIVETMGRVNGRLEVSEPKTERSRRTVYLSPDTVAVLRTHRDAQQVERRAAGQAWSDLGLVFATEAGGYVDPRNALRAITSAATRAGLDNVGVHTLRHSAASAMLGAGVPLHTVSEVLGHSSVAITGDVYGHVSTDGAKDALERLSAALG